MVELANGDLLFEVSDGVARLRLNRPSKANSITFAMLKGIIESCQNLAQQKDVNALVLEAEGQNFSGGVDLAVMDVDKNSKSEYERYLAMWDLMIDALQSHPVPVIAAIQGPAIAGGLSIAFACHIRVASTDARFGYPRIPQGHLPGRHNLSNLVKLIGPGRTRLILEGAMVLSAARAYDWGLVDLLTTPESLEREIVEMTHKMVGTPRPVLEMTHKLISDPENDALWNAADQKTKTQ